MKDENTLETSGEKYYTQKEERTKLHLKRASNVLYLSFRTLVDEFNSTDPFDESRARVFMLSTKAGGLGINLQTGENSLVSSVVSQFTRFECSFPLHSFRA